MSPKISHKKTIAIQHGIDFDYYPQEEAKRFLLMKLGAGHIVKFFQRRRALLSFSHAHFRVCVDYNFWNWYRTFSLPHEDQDIFVIPNFTEIPDLKREYKNKKVRILFARRFVERRGLAVFLDAVRIINSQNIDVCFTIAGSGPMQEKVNDVCKKYSNVSTVSYAASEALSLHEKHDIAVIPTLGSEGTSFSLLEAMASGNVVICTPVGGMSNIILNGYNGIFIQPYSSTELANAIMSVVSDVNLRMRLSQMAHETAKYAFSKEIWKQRWLNVLHIIEERS